MLVRYTANRAKDDPTERLALSYDRNGELLEFIELDPTGKLDPTEITEDQYRAYADRYALVIIDPDELPEPEAEVAVADVVARPTAAPTGLSATELASLLEQNADDVVEYLVDNPQHADQVVAAESAGKNRTTITSLGS